MIFYPYVATVIFHGTSEIFKNMLPMYVQGAYIYIRVFILPFIFEFPFKLFSAPCVFKLLASRLADDWNSYGNTC